MKIIAKTKHGFVVTASEDELIHLVGHEYLSSLPAGVKLDIGASIQVGKMWDHLYRLAKTRGELKKAAESLRAAADVAVEVAPVLCPPVVENV